jgi:hypothetical protein
MNLYAGELLFPADGALKHGGVFNSPCLKSKNHIALEMF